MKNLFFYICILLSTNFVYSQVPSLNVQDTFGNTQLLTNIIDNNKNQLILFWAPWNYPSKNQLDHWKVYSQNWIDNYNVEIFCISVFSDPSQIQTAKNLWNDKGWIGKLLFATNVDVTNIGIGAIPQTLLINTSNSTIYNHLGYTSGDEIELNQFITENLPVGTIEQNLSMKNIIVSHYNNTIKIESLNNLNDCSLSLYTIDGKFIFTHNIEINSTKYEVPESIISNNKGLCVVQIKQNTYSKSTIIYIP